MIWTTQPRSKTGGLATIRAGQNGPLVVLIHGVGLRAEAWLAQIDALAPDHRVIAVDMPGHGDSDALAGVPDLADYSDAIAALLDEPTVVIGHSMGAMIALDLATRHTDKLRGLVAMNAVFERSPQAARAVQARADELASNGTPDPTGPLSRWFGDTESAEKTACRDWLTTGNPAGYKAAYRVFAHHDGPSRAALQEMLLPALFLTAQNDPNSTPDMSRAMAALPPNGRAHIVAGAAHMLLMTHPAEVNTALRGFLAALGSHTTPTSPKGAS